MITGIMPGSSGTASPGMMRGMGGKSAPPPKPPESSSSELSELEELEEFLELQKMQAEEARLLREERNYTANPKLDDVSVHYDYAIGPDGQRYIVAARVTWKENASGETGENKGIAGAEGSGKTGRAENSGGTEKTERGAAEDPEMQQAISKLEQRDREVRAHEAAHMAVGGQYAGSATYTYQTGPDGKRYAIGGEVPISAPKGETPEETIRIMQQVKAAALAPAKPSGQDMQVAAAAAQAEAEARQEMAAERTEEVGTEGDVPALYGKNGVEAARWAESLRRIEENPWKKRFSPEDFWQTVA